MFTTGRGDDLFTLVGRAEILRVTPHNGIAQFGRASDGGVLGKVIPDGLDRGVLDMLRRGKMRLPGAEIHYVDTLLAKPVGFSHNRQSCGGFDPVNASGEFHSGRGFRYWAHRLPALGFLACSSFTAGSSFSRSLC